METEFKEGDRVRVWGYDSSKHIHDGTILTIVAFQAPHNAPDIEHLRVVDTFGEETLVHPRQCELVQRAKEKPKRYWLLHGKFHTEKPEGIYSWPAIELTPEVEAALREKGLL